MTFHIEGQHICPSSKFSELKLAHCTPGTSQRPQHSWGVLAPLFPPPPPHPQLIPLHNLAMGHSVPPLFPRFLAFTYAIPSPSNPAPSTLPTFYPS